VAEIVFWDLRMSLFDRLPYLLLLVLSVLTAGKMYKHVIYENEHHDLFIYTSGARLALKGETPYNIDAIHEMVAQQYPDDEVIQNNSGFFLSPQALLVLAPFASLPWMAGKAAWCTVMFCLTLLTAWQLIRLTEETLHPWLAFSIAMWVAFNWMTMAIYNVGQTGLLMLSCITLGEVLWRSGWKRFSAILWAVAFIKPHIAIALIPLAFALDGWKRALEVAFWAGVLNLITGLVFFGKPLFILDFVKFVEQGHQTVEFNRLVLNKQILSWNRIYFSLGGEGFEMGITRTFLGFLIVSVVVFIRQRIAGEYSRQWLLACAGGSMVVCCQVLACELTALFLALPYLAQNLVSPSWRSRSVALACLGFMAWAWTDSFPGNGYYEFIDSWCTNDWLHNVLETNRSISCCMFLLIVLIAGPGKSTAGIATGEKSLLANS